MAGGGAGGAILGERIPSELGGAHGEALLRCDGLVSRGVGGRLAARGREGIWGGIWGEIGGGGRGGGVDKRSPKRGVIVCF